MKVNGYSTRNQTDFNEEIRRSCRIAVDRFGGLRAFAQAIGEDEGKWFNRLTDGRVVGFDVEWLNTILEITEDHEVLLPFFKHNRSKRIKILIRICNKFDHFVFPCKPFRAEGKKNETTTRRVVSNLLDAAQRFLVTGRGT